LSSYNSITLEEMEINTSWAGNIWKDTESLNFLCSFPMFALHIFRLWDIKCKQFLNYIILVNLIFSIYYFMYLINYINCKNTNTKVMHFLEYYITLKSYAMAHIQFDCEVTFKESSRNNFLKLSVLQRPCFSNFSRKL
jgi:hypothetical protein